MSEDLSAVIKWMQHAEHYHWCPATDGDNCTCGLNKALDAVSRIEAEWPSASET